MMQQVPVRDIKLKNKEFLTLLENYKDFLMERDPESKEPEAPYVAKELPVMWPDEHSEDWTDDAFLNKIRFEGRQHAGFPDRMRSLTGLKYSQVGGADACGPNIKKKTEKFLAEIMGFLSCRNNALATVYPPGGFISWHNNANADGYNIIITWSETGEGWFDYWDNEKQERIRVQDVPGWQAKMTYFGSYEQPEKLCYHAAHTDCWRITVAFVFAEADNFWEEVIEDLETDC